MGVPGKQEGKNRRGLSIRSEYVPDTTKDVEKLSRNMKKFSKKFKKTIDISERYGIMNTR